MKDNNISGSPKYDRCSNWSEMGKIVLDISWSWNGWLPIGFVIILAGSSGTGKSLLLLRICGCFTLGWNWPDGTPFEGETGSVLWCEGEAAQAINLDRARKFGLDLSKFITPFNDPLQDVNLDNDEHLERISQIATNNKDVKLIVVDSLRGVNGQDENSSEINGLIKSLAEIARDTGKTIIITHHLRKKSFSDGEEVEIERLRGSSAIAQSARVIWAIDNPGGNENLKRLRVIKSNLGKFPPPIGFTITENGVDFTTAPSTPQNKTQLEEAIVLLKELLKNGPTPCSEIKKDFEERGISWRTANSAKKRLGVISMKISEKKGCWVWELPSKDEQQD